MKIFPTITIILLSVLFFNQNSAFAQSANLAKLAKAINGKVEILTNKGRVSILANDILCKKINCQISTFKTNKYEVFIYPKEDLFMRKIGTYLVVQEWGEKIKLGQKQMN